MATLALLCFVVAVLGPLLMRVSRQSSSVTTQPVSHGGDGRGLIGGHMPCPYRPAEQHLHPDDHGPAFRHTTCSAVTDTLATLRRVRIVVTPDDSILSTPDTVTVYRVNSRRINPFNAP